MPLSPSRRRHPALEVRAAADDDAYVVALYGELDLAGKDHLRRELGRAEHHPGANVVVDLSGLQFMDSAGLTVLIEAQRRAEADGRELTLLRGPSDVERLFVLTGTKAMFRFDD